MPFSVSKRFRKIAILITVLLLGGGLAVLQFKRQDGLHQSYYTAGSTINGFLGDYATALKTAIKSGDITPMAQFYTDDFSSSRGKWVWRHEQHHGGVEIQRLQADGNHTFDKAGVQTEIGNYVATVKTVKKVKMKIDLIEEINFGENVRLSVKYILLGTDHQDQLFEDRIFYRWTLVNVSGSPDYYEWQMKSDGLVEGVRVLGDGAVFQSLDPLAVGIDYKHRRDPKLEKVKYADDLEFEVIEHAMGGVSGADWDQDGRPDLFFCDGVRSRLYRNVTETPGSPMFVDETARLGDVDQAAVGLFGDIDNDGDQDLFVARYLAPCQLFINDGENNFTDKAAEYGLALVEPVTSAVFLDYDVDGHLDLFLGLNGNAFEAFPRIPMFALNAEPNRLYRSKEGRAFEDVTAQSGVGNTGWTLALAVDDYNLDGFPDIAVANDFGRKELLRNNGDGTFTDVAKSAGVLDFSGGMGILFADINNDGRPDIYTSNIKSNQRWFGEDVTMDQYLHNAMRTKYFVLDSMEYMKLLGLVGMNWKQLGLEVGEGNSLFYNNGDETFRELKDSHTNQAGWGWSISALDYDNDRDLDLYAVNGWISNDPTSDL